MNMRAFTNHQDHAVHIGGKTIMPGDTREIHATDHPDYQRPVAEPDPVPDAVAALLEQPVKDVIQALSGLDDEQLAHLDLLEQAQPKPRRSLIQAIANAQLERAQDDANGEADG